MTTEKTLCSKKLSSKPVKSQSFTSGTVFLFVFFCFVVFVALLRILTLRLPFPWGQHCSGWGLCNDTWLFFTWAAIMKGWLVLYLNGKHAY